MRYHDFTLYCQALQREQIWRIYRKFPIYMPYRSDLSRATISVSKDRKNFITSNYISQLFLKVWVLSL